MTQPIDKMAEHSNRIGLNDSLLSALIDPHYTPAEVFQYWREIAADLLYLGSAPLKEDELPWDQQRLTAVTNDRRSILVPAADVQRSGDTEELEAFFGLPVYRPGITEADQWILAFMSPGGKTEFPVTFNLTRNIVYEKPYSILSIDITPGTWGSRHLHYQAIAKVYRCLHAVDPQPEDDQITAEAGGLARQLEEWETREVDFSRIRQRLWLAVNLLVGRFSKGKPAILRQAQPAGLPHDLNVIRPGTYEREVPQYGSDVFEHAVWIEQLQWWENTPARKRSIAWWASQKTTEAWDRLYAVCMQARKGTWPSVVEVLGQPPVSPMDMERLITFLQDLNWPGAFEAFEFLTRRENGALEYIDDAIEQATRLNDEPWLDWLHQARSNLTDE